MVVVQARQATYAGLAVDDNPMPESNLFPCSGIMNIAAELNLSILRLDGLGGAADKTAFNKV